MAKRAPLPKSELEIAKIVWRLKEATVRQVVEAMPKSRNADFWTVQTYLRRLAAKGYLCTRREGRSNVYLPSVRPGKVVGEVIEDLVRRLFDGQTMPLVQHLINDRGLSDDDIDALQTTLNQLKKRKKSS